MFNKMKLLFYHSKKRTNRRGEAPIYCRITTDGESAEISTGITVPANHFKDGYVTAENDQWAVYNTRINYFKTKLSTIHLDMCMNGKIAYAHAVKEKFLHKPLPQKTFLEMLQDLVNEVESTNWPYNTKKSYKCRAGNIKRFFESNGLSKVTCCRIDPGIINKLKDHFVKKKHKHSYINKHLFLIGQVLKLAIKSGYIDKNIVQFMKKDTDDVQPIVALTKQELCKLQQYKFVSERLQQVADVYVFQCYTGFAYVDLKAFDTKKHLHLINGKMWISEARTKTKHEALLPLFKDAARILKKYNGNLPVLSIQKYNCYIKEVAEIIGFKKHLTTHTARKTFGMVKLNEGFSIESVARMLGHSTIKVTQKVYAKVTHVRIENERKNLRVA